MTDCNLHDSRPNRRDVLVAAGATVLMSTHASGSASAAVRPEGYFLVFNQRGGGGGVSDPAADRIFFIPSQWLELFELTEVYKDRYPELVGAPSGYKNWKEGLERVRKDNQGHPKKMKISALYATFGDPGVEEPFPGKIVVGPNLPDVNQTYLAMSISPPVIPDEP
jgi:hypothetical protein